MLLQMLSRQAVPLFAQGIERLARAGGCGRAGWIGGDAVSERWTQAEALALCREIEAIAPGYGCHVALTGGLLYKDGPRKDADILLYRIRQCAEIDEEGLFAALANIGVNKTGGFGWCHKAQYRGKQIDFFFPEEDGDYQTGDDDLDLTLEDFQ